MYCKNCGASAEDTERYCPTCGEELTATAPSSDPESLGEAGVPAKKGKKSRWPAVLAAVLLLAAMAAGLVFGGVVPLPGRPAGTVVAEMPGGARLYDSELCYYYWTEAYNLSSYAGYAVVDLEKPMSGQAYVDDTYATWHDWLVDAAAESWYFYTKLYDAAVAEGYALDAELEEQLGTLPASLKAKAEADGLESVAALLQKNFGPLASEAGYQDYVARQYLAISYANSRYEALAEPYLSQVPDSPTADVRHILFLTGGGDDDSVRLKAEDVYAQWQKTGTEDAFVQLAQEHSEDGNAQEGGIYENVTPGMMVAEFNDWLFDPARKAGDSGIVQTTFGYHIMYYVGAGEPAPSQADTTAAEQKAQADYEQWAGTVAGEPDYTVFYDKVPQW